ncbi:MAG TPA: chemotaxis protein CheW, partial [Nocardioidaceae bacterium]|nr:chemotaxis protein CheW [Nocardioidaceae bacterium]
MTLTTAARESRLCTFIVGDLLLGLPVEEVSEVVRAEVLTPVPLAPSGVLGLLNLRGRIVTAV